MVVGDDEVVVRKRRKDQPTLHVEVCVLVKALTKDPENALCIHALIVIRRNENKLIEQKAA